MIHSLSIAECRSQPRHTLNLELQFCYRSGRRTYLGTGRTKDFSDNVICFESDQELPEGAQLELCIAWPASLHSVYPLEMIVHGPLVRKQNGIAVLHMEGFEFRPCGEVSFHTPANRGDLCNLLA